MRVKPRSEIRARLSRADESSRYSLSTRHVTPVVDRDVDHRALAKPRWKRRQRVAARTTFRIYGMEYEEPVRRSCGTTTQAHKGLEAEKAVSADAPDGRSSTPVLKRRNSLATWSPSKFMFGRGDRGMQCAGRLRMERAAGCHNFDTASTSEPSLGPAVK
jgi:hypothetical protein